MTLEGLPPGAASIADSPWQPVVLMLLAAASVVCRIALSVRAFLYLGASFLLISILTMIRHAAANLGWSGCGM